MTDQKITQLTVGVPDATDIIPYVSDPSGSPVTKKSLVSSLLFRLIIGTYVDLNPITANGRYPYAATVSGGMTFRKLTQTIYAAGSAHSGSAYYTYNLWFRKAGASDLLIATFNTQTLVNGTNVFTVTSFTNASITGSGYVFIELLKTSTPSDIYIVAPDLTASLS